VLILVRHGRTEANAGGLLQGRIDLPLDDTGREQVRRVSAAIGTPDVLIASPLLRARQTADAFGVSYTVDERWQEVAYGEYEGKPLRDVAETEWQEWRSDPHYCVPGGESLATLDVRVRQACVELLDIAREHTVVVVSHVSPIKAAVAWSLGVDILMSWRCQLDQAAVCRISVNERGPALRTFNEVLHA
jgi:broad specificity phosphatase PhoE